MFAFWDRMSRLPTVLSAFVNHLELAAFTFLLMFLWPHAQNGMKGQ